MELCSISRIGKPEKIPYISGSNFPCSNKKKKPNSEKSSYTLGNRKNLLYFGITAQRELFKHKREINLL